MLNKLPTFQQVSEWLRYDHETGRLFWIKRPCHNVFAGAIAGTKTQSGYIQICVQKRLYKAHRIAWLLHYGKWPDSILDHINGNRTDNRIDNLRVVSPSMNSQNQRRPQRRNVTGVLGVSPTNGRWRAEIFVSGKKKYLGTFDSPERAHMAYIEEKRKSHHGCTI